MSSWKHLLRSLPRPLQGAALATLLTGACVISAEGELPDVQVTQHDVTIPAAPANPRGGDVPVAVSFAQTPSRAGLNRKAFSDVRILGIEVSARSGVPDLSFLTSLRLSATSAEAEAAGRQPVQIGNFARSEHGTAGPRLVMDNPSPPDVTELWRSSQVIFTLEAAGRMPNVTWTADVGLRFEATLSY